MYKNKKLAAFMVSMLALSFAACGGGGEEDEDDVGGDDEEEDASGAGIWSGTFRIDGLGTGQPMGGIVTEEGDFAFATLGTPNARMHFGMGSTNGNSFTASATSYSAGASVPSSFMGTIVDGVSITGSYSLAGESALFNLAYSSHYVRPASLATLTGTYTLTAPATGSNPATTLTVDVIANGNFVFTNSATGCSISGNFTVPHANRNYYRWTGTAAGCPGGDGSMSGVAYLDDVTAGQSKQLVMFVRHQTQPSAGLIVVTKP